MPYGEDDDSSKPSKRASRHAKRYKIKNYARIETPDGLKRALYMIGPCFIVLPKYHDGEQFWRKSRGRSLRDSTAVGHAVAVLGYNKHGFILLNSWGPTWNGNGLTLLPYKHWDKVWETWVSYTVPEKPKKGLLSRLFRGKKLKRAHQRIQ
jgi:C1A family cysteine protease